MTIFRARVSLTMGGGHVMKAGSGWAGSLQLEAREFDAQIGATIARLLQHAGTARGVHETRNRLTQMRASLRLLRASLGDDAYRRCNTGIRDAARQLNAVRDAQVLVQTANQLRRSNDSLKVKQAVGRLVRALTQDRNATCPRAAAASQSTAILRAIQCHVKDVSPSELAAAEPAAGLVKTYKQCRRAFHRAQRRPTDIHLHEWRKKMKYLFCETAALARLNVTHLSQLNRRASRLTLCLGEDRDWAVLQARLRDPHLRARVKFNGRLMDQLSRRSNRRRTGLQQKAMRLGQTCFEQRARRFGIELTARSAT